MSPVFPAVRGRTPILSQSAVARGYWKIALAWGDCRPGRLPLPGQFFTLLPFDYPLTMLRRPFAYSGADSRGFSFIYEVRGKVTQDLADAPEGTLVDWIGPSGSSFPLPPDGIRPVIVAGGIGVGPMLFFASAAAAAGFEPLVILGARTAAMIPRLPWPQGTELRICTDDGSEGIRGTAIAGIRTDDIAGAGFYTCGPEPMMAAVHRIAVEYGCACLVSMEAMMACGVGACQGCAVPVVNPESREPLYKRACAEGPVFDSREIVWPSRT
jgi:dihydroorotate dehydrogenase electron transfer subunit